MKKLLLAFFLCTQLFAQNTPQLIIDTKGHAGIVSDVIITSPTEVISVSQDKTIRIWDTENNSLKRTLRINIGQNIIGAIYSASYSTKSDLLAVAGFFAPSSEPLEMGKIILIKLSTGKIVQELKQHKNTVNDLQFSPNGEYLASVDSDGKLCLWKNENTEYKKLNCIDAHLKSCNSIAISTNLIVTGGDDNMVKCWKYNESGLGTNLTSSAHGSKVTAVAISPEGTHIVSAADDNKLILYNASFDVISTIENIDVASTAFDETGKKIVVGCGDPFTVKVFSSPSLSMYSQFTKHNSLVTACGMRNDKIISAGGTANELFYWDCSMPSQFIRIAGKANPRYAVGVAAGPSVAFSSRQSESDGVNTTQLEKGFDFSDFSVLNNVISSKFLREVILNGQGSLKKVTDNQLQIDTKSVIELEDKNDIIRTYTYTKEGNIIIGSDFELDLYNTNGEYLRSFKGNNGTTWSVAVTNDNKFLVAVGDDQSIKIWNLEDKGEYETPWEYYSEASWRNYFKENNLESIAQKKGKSAWFELIDKVRQLGGKNPDEMLSDMDNLICTVNPLLNLFVSSDNEWVVWTNEGYYNASAGGEKFIGWQVNGSGENLADFYPASAFRNQFFKPEVIRNILLNPDQKTIQQITVNVNVNDNKNETTKEEIKPTSILQSLPPKIEILSPTQYKTTSSVASTKVKVKIKSDKKITAAKIFVNGAKGKEEAPKESIAFRGGKEKINDSTYVFDVDLSVGENSIMVYASNENGNAVSNEVVVEYKTANTKTQAVEEIIKPNLYMISIGISDFKDPTNNLDFADDDAIAMSKLFKEQKGLLYKNVEVKELTNSQATRLNIIEAFEWLGRSVTSKDVAIIFIATHGFNQKEKFYILPHDGDFESYKATCVNWNDFADILKDLPCKTLMFLDACHSGQLGKNLYASRGVAETNSEAIRELASDASGVVIFSGSTGAEKSLESNEWKHGAFTYAILDGVNNKTAEYKKDNIIYLNELDNYIAEKVKELTKGQQHPTTQKPSTISNLPLFMIK